MKTTRIEMHLGDITKLPVDVIVNAANNRLAGGGGVDGAIHRAAGPELLSSCLKLNGCKTGEVKMTAGFNLPVKAVFHAVGPVWQGGSNNEAALLRQCYMRSIILAESVGYRSIAFPAISCGVYGYPLGMAADIAINSVRAALSDNSSLVAVTFCCFDERTLSTYQAQLSKG